MSFIPKLLKVTKYLNYTEVGNTGKTKLVGVGNNYGEKLGYIKYHSPWRKYIFSPITDSLYDTSCLKDICDFIDELMAERKIAQKVK